MTINRGMRRRTTRENEGNKRKRSECISEIDEVVLDDNHSAESVQVEESEDDLDFGYDEFYFLDNLDVEDSGLHEEDLDEDEDLDLPEEDLDEDKDKDLDLPEEDLDEDEDLDLLEEDFDVEEELGIPEEDIITQFKPCNVPNKTRQVTATGSGLTIVKANTGNRIVLNHSIVKALGITTDIQFGYSESSSQIMIGKDLPNDFAKYNVKLQKNQSAIVYNKNLVAAIISNFGLDFTNCTSQTFASWKAVTQNDFEIVLVDIC